MVVGGDGNEGTGSSATNDDDARKRVRARRVRYGTVIELTTSTVRYEYGTIQHELTTTTSTIETTVTTNTITIQNELTTTTSAVHNDNAYECDTNSHDETIDMVMRDHPTRVRFGPGSNSLSGPMDRGVHWKSADPVTQ